MNTKQLSIIACVLLFGFSATRADVVTEWNAIMEQTAHSSSQNPAEWSRTAAITHVAMFEAVNSIAGDYEPYHEKVKAADGASQESAVIAAAHRALSKLHSAEAAQLDDLRDKALAAIADGPAKKAGVAIGIAAADSILTLRADDGFFTPVPYTPETAPGEYRPTPPEFIPPFMPWLGQVKPFVIRNGKQFRSAPPPGLRSKRYVRDYKEVKRVGETNSSERPQDRSRVAIFYGITDADGIYYPAARQIIATRTRTLAQNARFFALLSMAIFDGAVACFETKYHFNLWRPVTAIHEAANDGSQKTEPDPKWQAFVFTPPFPAYPSGHASFGGAARAVLEEELGPDGHAITLANPQVPVPDITLKYTTFKQITDDIDDARIFGGVHYRFDQEAGALQGKRVGEYVMRHALRPACERRQRGPKR